MDWHEIALAVTGLTSAVFGWLLRTLWEAVRELRKDLDALRVHIAENYVPQTRLDKALEQIMGALRRIEDVLANKADRP